MDLLQHRTEVSPTQGNECFAEVGDVGAGQEFADRGRRHAGPYVVVADHTPTLDSADLPQPGQCGKELLLGVFTDHEYAVGVFTSFVEGGEHVGDAPGRDRGDGLAGVGQM